MVTLEMIKEALPDWGVENVGSVDECGDCLYEIYRHSPDGEEVLMTIQGSTLGEMSDSAFAYYDDFDADDHAAEIYHAKHHGTESERRFYASAPDDLEALMKDARAIDEMYYDVGDRLRAASIEIEGVE